MIEKLYALAEGEISPENSDVLSTQDFLLPGHLCLNFLKETLENTMDSVKLRFIKESTKAGNKVRDLAYLEKVIEQHADIGKKMEYLLATGNLISRTGLDLMQTSGFAIIADRINYSRYTSHFQSVHRGAYFTEMKISSVRKLHPESWGFLCPVHTPDGAPCGLLNHLSSRCRPLGKPLDFTSKEFLNVVKGTFEFEEIKEEIKTFPKEAVPLVLNGKIVAFTDQPQVAENVMRNLKVEGKLPKSLEIAYLPGKPFYPGIFLFSGEGRLVREVIHLQSGKVEWIGPLEQLNLKISCNTIDPTASHKETTPLSMLSLLACCIPFPDHNQSPRNMYQCQMAKQTMGTAIYNYPFRADNKIYRITTPQKPLVSSRTKQVKKSGFDDYPSGTNAVVAVISYTGYDMEDAMIINKSAYERGFGHGYVYKTKFKEISSKDVKCELIGKDFANESLSKGLDVDGLAFTGSRLLAGQSEMMLFDKEKKSNREVIYKDSEAACLDDIKLMATDKEFKVSYKYRLLRNPIIGDKFSSRHGQKGVLSILWPQEDMPFTDQGITPDVIINPHAFPSRMTIGMLIESMAGKAGALEGKFQESAAFQNFDKLEEFGSRLIRLGFNYFGSEKMYSGIFGNEMTADIYLGVVYYQRLRHMVADKFQARSTGPVDILTNQPVKGRKKHGGIRLGEMERDSLLGHGGAFMLYDRLFKCSDESSGFLCESCGSILTAFMKVKGENAICSLCGTEAQKVSLPFVLRYLTNELAAMGIKLKFKAA
jgi:DNA-directed RNA polymerase I subunit RPA2